MTQKTLEEQTAEVLEYNIEAAISPISPSLINTLLHQWQERCEIAEDSQVHFKVAYEREKAGNIALQQRVDILECALGNIRIMATEGYLDQDRKSIFAASNFQDIQNLTKQGVCILHKHTTISSG